MVFKDRSLDSLGALERMMGEALNPRLQERLVAYAGSSTFRWEDVYQFCALERLKEMNLRHNEVDLANEVFEDEGD